ncbi:MAG TPA: DUF167 family protein [Methyloceanibacter sp.]|nr:DUF167 family protein [Methyloceanibacter sp.]
MIAAHRLRLQHTGTGVTLKVRLTPKSSRDAIEGLEDFGGEIVLKARVRALPEQGRANAALVKLIASWLKLPPSQVSVAQGGKSRIKQVAIEGDAEEIARLIEARLSELARE